MSWTAPRTYVSGEVITASILNTDLRDNLTHLGGTHAHDAAAGGGTADLGSLGVITFADQAGAPGAIGTMQRNGSALEYHNGSVIARLSADAGTGTASMRTLGTGGTQAAAGDHEHSPTATANSDIRTGTPSVTTGTVHHHSTIFTGTLETVLNTTALAFGGTNRTRVVGAFVDVFHNSGAAQNGSLLLYINSINVAVFSTAITDSPTNSRPQAMSVSYIEQTASSTITVESRFNGGAPATYISLGHAMIQEIMRTPSV